MPFIIFGVFNFIFQGSTQDSKNQQFLLNCPLPINNGVATLVNIVDGVRLNYTVSVSGSQFTAKNYNGTFFECTIDPNSKQPGANTRIKNYGAVLEFFGAQIIGYGWFAWVGDSVTSFVDNIVPLVTLVYLYLIAPADITGLSWFAYVNVILIGWIGLGLFMVVRGS